MRREIREIRATRAIREIRPRKGLQLAMPGVLGCLPVGTAQRKRV